MKPKVLALLFSIFFVGAGLEIGLRLFGPFKQAGKTPDNILWQPDTKIGFSPAVNLNAVVYTAEWINQIRTNEFGFRISEGMPVIKGPAFESMLFLGDSQTMGVQVPEEATFVALIGSELARRNLALTVINAGCNAFNTVQEYLFFKQLYEQGLRPKIVVMYVVNNDLYEDGPELPYGQYSIDRNGDITLLPPDPSSLDRLRRAKETPQRQANFWLRHSALLRHLWYLYRLNRTPYDIAAWVKNTYVRDDRDPFARQRWATASAAVRTLNRLVSSYGGRLIIAVHPDPVEWSDAYYTKLVQKVPEMSDQIDRMKLQAGYKRVAEGVGISFINMLNEFPPVSVRDFRFAMDPHANVSGHRIIAQQLLKGFLQIGLVH